MQRTTLVFEVRDTKAYRPQVDEAWPGGFQFASQLYHYSSCGSLPTTMTGDSSLILAESNGVLSGAGVEYQGGGYQDLMTKEAMNARYCYLEPESVGSLFTLPKRVYSCRWVMQ